MSELLLPKGEGTEPSVQSTRSQRRRESRWVRAAPWQERAGVWRGKSGLHSEGRQIPRKGGQARGASLGEVEGSMSG